MKDETQTYNEALSACGPITTPLFILIVEDDDSCARLSEFAITQQLIGRFPDARISHTASRLDAQRIIEMRFPPDAVVLDLVLSDSTFEETLACVEKFETRSAVVIVTGHLKSRVEALLVNHEVEILEKKAGFFEKIVAAISRAILRRSKVRSDARLARMAELLRELEPPAHADSK